MINDKQFFIAKSNNSIFTDWEKIALSEGYTLHYHKDLNIGYHCENIVLIGYAWQVDPNRKSPQEELEQLAKKTDISHEDVYDVEKTWCGRYILIVNDWMYTDTCATLGVFYDEIIVTSSLNVLCIIEGRPLVFPEITHGKLPDFFPGMRTPYENVKRLLPSQILNYTDREYKIRPLLIDTPPNFDSKESRAQDFVRYFVHSAQNLSKLFVNRTIWLAVTGGRDSRTTLACFEKAKIEYKTFTLWHNQISLPDYIIPQKLAKVVHHKHLYLLRDETQFSQIRYSDYKTHTSGMAVDEDWNFYAYNQYQALRSGNEQIVIVRNGVWEIASFFFLVHFKEKSNNLTTLFPGIKDNELFYKSVMEWKEFVEKDSKNTSLVFRDRIYWDLRGGCWLSSIEQSFDLMDGITSIQTANCRLFLSLLFGFDPKDRAKKIHEEKIVEVLFPPLAKIPYDYQYETFTQRIHRYKKEVKKIIKNIIGKK